MTTNHLKGGVLPTSETVYMSIFQFNDNLSPESGSTANFRNNTGTTNQCTATTGLAMCKASMVLAR
jgi:hypothetical protein